MIHDSGGILLSGAAAIAHGIVPNDHFHQGLALALREKWPKIAMDFRHYMNQCEETVLRICEVPRRNHHVRNSPPQSTPRFLSCKVEAHLLSGFRIEAQHMQKALHTQSTSGRFCATPASNRTTTRPNAACVTVSSGES